MIPLKCSGRAASGLVAGALIAGALVVTTVPTAHAGPLPGDNVLILNDPDYVDTIDLDDYQQEIDENDGEAYHEAPNMILALRERGHSVTEVLGTDASTIRSALVGKEAFVIPEMEDDMADETPDWAADLNAQARAAVTDWVRGGGTLVIAGDYEGDTISGLFGYARMNELGAAGPWPNVSPSSSPFNDGPESLPGANATATWPLADLPGGAVVHYGDDETAVVFSTSQGKGTVVSLGWDWYDAAPAGYQDAGWNAVLDSAVRIGDGVAAAAPSNRFTVSKAKVNRKKATMTLSVKLPSAGQVKVVGARKGQVKTVSKNVKGSTTVTLKPTKKTMKKLRKKLRNKKVAKQKVKVKITFTPTGGEARTMAKTYVLKLKKAKKK